MTWLSCWFGHQDRIRERDDQGRLILVCLECGDVLRPLEAAAVIGPAHRQARDRGARTMTAKRQYPENVTDFRQSQR